MSLSLVSRDVPHGGSCAASCQRIASCRVEFPEMKGSEAACLFTPSRYLKNVFVGECWTPAMAGHKASEGLERGDLL